MSGAEDRDDATYLADVRHLAHTLLRLLDRKNPVKEKPQQQIPGSIGKVVEIAPPILKPERPRSRLRQLSEGRGRDMRHLADLPDVEIIRLAKKGGRILRPGDVSKVRSAAGRNGTAADIISAMDRYGLFDS